MKTLLLIDANSLIHRSFHALPPLTTKDGRPGQALYGMSSILLKLFREDPPDYAAALFDRPEPTFRKIKYAEYKATRLPTAEGLIEQIIAAHDLFPQFGIRVFEEAGFEADDLIATFAKAFRKDDNLRVVILTGDLDTLQLVRGEKIVVRVFRRGLTDTITYGEDTVRERYGLLPNQLADYKALVGDTSDNVKGVPGVGPKTAVTLLQKYGSLDRIFDAAGSDKLVASRIVPFRAQADLSHQLVVLDGVAHLPVSALDELRATSDEDRLRAYFEYLGFGSLSRRIGAEVNPTRARAVAPRVRKREKPVPPQGAMF